MKFFSFILKMLVVLIGLQSYAVATPSMNETCIPDSYHVQPSSNNKISKKLSAIKTKIVDYAKLSGNTLKNIFSYKNQCIMAGILVSLYLLPMVQSSMVDSKPLHQIPAIIPSICKAMNYKFIPSAIKISTKLGFNACAGSDGVITLSQKLLDNMPSNELGFIIGHEIAHIQKNHHNKGALIVALLYLPIHVLNIMPALYSKLGLNLRELVEEKYNLTRIR